MQGEKKRKIGMSYLDVILEISTDRWIKEERIIGGA